MRRCIKLSIKPVFVGWITLLTQVRAIVFLRCGRCVFWRIITSTGLFRKVVVGFLRHRCGCVSLNSHRRLCRQEAELWPHEYRFYDGRLDSMRVLSHQQEGDQVS